ncbi:MFS transporter [Ammoniphilus sp. CFH 90114]|uniref:MFS transporter n=1 Tax=Ammoniphilus sp. CFH 90114 TaxID=2493665 RepID=UPI00100FF4B5|nr:MFS transporter [Ammoniphilus sp. CFH 90114]RXT08132.1 MFS transporter [Ammoniphilus sp. CFH 90114]
MLTRNSFFTPLQSLFSVQLIFCIIFSFANLFMNIFLWDRGQSFWAIGVFNLFSVASIFIASLAGAYLLHLLGTRSTFMISSILALGLFLYLFHAGQASQTLLPVLGLLYGGYVGLFYIGFNLHILQLSDPQNRSYLIGMESTIATVAQLITPLCAGLFITSQGYSHTFFIIIALLILQFLFSAFIPSMKMTEKYQKRYFFLAENEEMAKMGFTSAAYGFYFSFVQMSYGLFFFFFLQNESQLGSWNFVFGAISAVMYWLIGKSLKQSNREIILGMGMISSIMVTLTLFLSAAPWFILFNLIVSIALPMMWIPAKSLHYAQIARTNTTHKEDGFSRMLQRLVFREFAISLGRISFFFIMIIGFDFGLGPAYYIMIALACFMPVGIWLLSRT